VTVNVIEHTATCFWHRGGFCTCGSDEENTVKSPTRREAPGGAHYDGPAVQPIDLIEAWNLDFLEGNVVKYVTRWRRKGGLEDLDKAAWYLERLRARSRNEVKT